MGVLRKTPYTLGTYVTTWRMWEANGSTGIDISSNNLKIYQRSVQHIIRIYIVYIIYVYASTVNGMVFKHMHAHWHKDDITVKHDMHFQIFSGYPQASSQLPDRRSEGDPAWLANGAQVELHSLQKAQTLNGQRGEIVGFDDKQLRYRVRLHSDNTVTWRI